jgi:hypothetical protein
MARFPVGQIFMSVIFFVLAIYVARTNGPYGYIIPASAVAGIWAHIALVAFRDWRAAPRSGRAGT